MEVKAVLKKVPVEEVVENSEIQEIINRKAKVLDVVSNHSTQAHLR